MYFYKRETMPLSFKHPLFLPQVIQQRQFSVKSRRMSCGKKLLKIFCNCGWKALVEVGILMIGSNKILHNWHLLLTKTFCQISGLAYVAGCYLPKRHLGELSFITCACRALLLYASHPNISLC